MAFTPVSQRRGVRHPVTVAPPPQNSPRYGAAPELRPRLLDDTTSDSGDNAFLAMLNQISKPNATQMNRAYTPAAEQTATRMGTQFTGTPAPSTATAPLNFSLLSSGGGDIPDQPPPPGGTTPPPPTTQPPPTQQPPPNQPNRPDKIANNPTIKPDVESMFKLSLDEIIRMGGTADDYGTMLRWIGDGLAQFGPEAMSVYVEQLRRAPGRVRAYFEDAKRAADAGKKGIHFVDWYAEEYGPQLSPLAGKMGAESAKAAAEWKALKQVNVGGPPAFPLPRTVFTPTTTPAPPGGTTPPPPTTQPPPTQPPPPVTPPPANTTPPPNTQPPPSSDPTLSFEGILDKQITDYLKRMNPTFESQRADVANRVTHLGAISGAINSGGFGQTMSDALGEQYAREQAAVAPQITDLTKNAQSLSLQKYQSELAAAVQREQIRSNADLEMAAQDLQRYGIDKNDFLERYKAQLALKGVQYSAQAQVDAAAMHAAASSAAANAQAQASMYNARLGYEAEIFRGDITREGNIMDYILGIAALGPEWAKFILGADPLGILTGNPPPGDVVINP